jgi:hypothetical protein
MSESGRERIVNPLLAHIENNCSNDHLRELAAGVRQGDGHLRDFLAASPYSQALQPALAEFGRWYDRLSDSERAEQAQRCQQIIDDGDVQPDRFGPEREINGLQP